MPNKIKCPICMSEMIDSYRYPNSTFYSCPVCGVFEITTNQFIQIDNSVILNPHTASYLYYNKFENGSKMLFNRYHTTLSKEKCDEYNRDTESGAESYDGHPVHMDNSIIDSWYPKTFTERIDNILLRVNSLAKHIGQAVKFDYPEMFSLLFIDRKEVSANHSVNPFDESSWRDKNECIDEADYMIDYLKENGYVKDYLHPRTNEGLKLTLTPKGYARVDELQKQKSFGHSALVAMKFGDDTIQLREAIRKGIQDAGYKAVFIDEVEHINFITPELLKHIRDSKFVVVDLTHQNNGAYFEEGYAMGLGKPVIQLCKEDVKLHFDIAQKNTIMWKLETDISIRLTNRIKATID